MSEPMVSSIGTEEN